MSSIVVVVADAPEDAARRALDRLAVAGVRDPELLVLPGVALGAASAGPREREDRPPATSTAGTVHLAFDGFLTNRSELLAALGGTIAPPSDAALFLLAYERWGASAVGKAEGSFAVAIVDETEGTVLLARDPIGDRSLFYWMDGASLVAASEEAGVLSYPCVRREPDHRRLAAHFSMTRPETGATFHSDVKEVPPAHTVTFRRGRLSVERYWEPEPPGGFRRRTDAEWADLFVTRLDEAVARCLGGPGRAGVLMSGGLDSCPIAALAARRVAPGRLTAVSWVFDELRSCDEREFIEDVAAATGLERVSIPGDGLWPLSDLATWPADAARPEHDPYRRLVDGGYVAAAEAGVATLLSGFAGDHIYVGGEAWFPSLLAELRPLEAFSRLREAVRAFGTYRAVRAFVISPLVPGWFRRPPAPKPWLTPYARRLLATDPVHTADAWARRRHAILNDWTASCTAREVRRAASRGVELRYPFRDKRFVELALELPAHQLARGRTTRPVVRRGFRELLPDSVVRRPGKTTLRALSDRGMSGPAKRTLEELISGGDRLWAEFVEPSWLAGTLRKEQMSEAEVITIWYCAFVDLWSRRVLESC